MQWLQDRNQRNLDTLNNVRCKTSRHFSIKRKEYLKNKIDELDTDNKITKLVTKTAQQTQETNTSMASAGLEPAIPAIERPLTYALDRTATGNMSA